ncbi:MAG: hypothetical protein BGO63_10515 [Candidatus Accumulibacter sp. 66-26]|nr:MAG: hypothetical protein BGO63_10515 [Candidatus Accumulibacter sp. 66-26]
MTIKLNRLDEVLQQVCPTVMVPRYEPLQDLDHEAHRFLVAQDGLYMDVLRPWLQLRLQISQSPIPLPYGRVAGKAVFNFGDNFGDLFVQFTNAAREFLPAEHAAWFAFDAETQCLRYEPVEVTRRNMARITYERPVVSEHVRLAVDIHSHGCENAYFSPTDDLDDVDDAKLAIVVGDLDKAQISVIARLVLPGGLVLDYSDFVRSLLSR